ncbi:MAG: tetratricopeptide repeat protein, partial [FCB group bacterium]|nr:tetratricopeptide repeat protein [FCB group bacterium]
MADMWELGQYVEDHPDAYEQRWRLAKKLYLACEYRLVLEHLQILKNEWTPKLNVTRYLAATYYRLGRYEESISELEEAIDIWPDEVGLREQLARVLETAGDSDRASAVWAQVERLDPDHALARKASERLISQHERSPQDELHIDESDSGIDLAPKLVCPACGAQNSVEFDRCWQCRAPLVPGAAAGVAPGAAGSPMPGVESGSTMLRRVFNIVAGLLFVALLAYGVYTGINGLPSQEAPPGIVVTPTVYAALFESLFNVRLVIGLVLLVASPIVLFLALNSVPSDQPNPGLVVLTGIVLAALGAATAWAPLQAIPELLVLNGIASFLVLLLLLGVT